MLALRRGDAIVATIDFLVRPSDPTARFSQASPLLYSPTAAETGTFRQPVV